MRQFASLRSNLLPRGLLMLLVAALVACGGGGGGGSPSPPPTSNPPPPPPAAANLTLSTTAVDSFGDLQGTVANAKTGVTYELEYALSAQARVRSQPLTLNASGAFTTTAPEGALDANGASISGSVNVKLLEVASGGAVTELNTGTMTITALELPADAQIGDATQLYANLQFYIASGILERKDRWSIDGFDLFPGFDVAPSLDLFAELGIAAAVIRSGAPQYTINVDGQGATYTITREVLEQLDLQFYRLMSLFPAPPQLPNPATGQASAALKYLLRKDAHKYSRFVESYQKWELTDYRTWTTSTAGDIRSTAKKMVSAVGVMAGTTGYLMAAGAAAATVVTAQAFLVGVVVVAGVTLAMEAHAAFIDKGQAEWKDAAPSARYLGESIVDAVISDRLTQFAERVCGRICDFGASVAQDISGLFDSAEDTVNSKFDDGTFPRSGTQSRGLQDLSLSAIGEALDPMLPPANVLVTVRFTPLTLSQPVTIRVAAKDPQTSEVFYVKDFTGTDTFQLRLPINNCRPSMTLVAYHLDGSLVRTTSYTGPAGNCDPGGGGNQNVDEYVSWRIGSSATRRVKPSNASLRALNSPINLYLDAAKTGNPDDDNDISIRWQNVTLAAPLLFTENCPVGVSATNLAMATHPNPPYENRFLEVTGEFVPYEMKTCDYATRHSTHAGGVTINTTKRTLADNPLTVGTEASELIVNGVFEFSVDDYPMAEASGWALGTKTVQGTFQFKAGICFVEASSNDFAGLGSQLCNN